MSSLLGRDKVVLAIGAHPDDVEFGCGGTMAKLASEGAILYFVICTDGNRGSRLNNFEKTKLIKLRQEEQEKAAKLLGAKEVIYLNEEDGNLIADISLKEKIVRIIRKIKPDIIFTHDPSYFYVSKGNYSSINHTDHRATGAAVLDAIYPLSRDLASFPDHVKNGLTPHIVKEVYLFNFDNPIYCIDVTDFIDKKLESIFVHKSQMDDVSEVEEWVRDRLSGIGKKIKVKYAEGFIRLALK